MLSLNLKTPFLSHPPPLLHHSPTPKHLSTISANLSPNSKPLIIPGSSSPSSIPSQNLYQPFRPPPSPLPSELSSLDTASRLEVLSNRLGPWHSYAPLISSLLRDSFTPSSLEEVTGISGVEQNRLVVAAQVRDSLIQSGTDPEIVAEFDTGGSELLYEIRLLSASQRSAAADYIVRNGFDAKGAQDLARAMKDFPKRKADKGWGNFEYKFPGDCLAFMYYRQSREYREGAEKRVVTLEKAMEAAVTENAKRTILEELKGKSGEREEEKEEEDVMRVPIVRMKIGEVSEASSIAVYPVCEGEEELGDAPWERRTEGEFGVVTAERAWKRWVVLPGWEPVLGIERGGVVMKFRDARILPWKVNRWSKEEGILVVVDRERKEVEFDDGFYMVAGGSGGSGGLVVERGRRLKEIGVEDSLGTVVLVVRPPREEVDDQLSDEDWE